MVISIIMPLFTNTIFPGMDPTMEQWKMIAEVLKVVKFVVGWLDGWMEYGELS